MNRKGYSSAFISMPLAAGLATESLADHINQRIRWARGMVQIFRIDNPLKGKGLTFAQRICFLNAMIHFLHGLPRIIFLLAPLPYLFANVYIIFASGIAILAYVLPHMVHSTMTNQQIQGNKRFYFWGVVYETILSWYITLPTLVALIAPKHGKFNVTAKGASNEKEWFDWTVSRPYILLILLNFAGFIYGVYNIIFNPYAEVSTILINLLWVSYNLLVLGAASAVALEAKQVRTSPRVRCAIDARLEIKDNESVDVVIRDFSKEGLGVELPENSKNSNLFELLNEGDCVYVNMDADSRTYRFKAHVRFASSKKLGLALELNGREQNIEYIRCTFACADRWSHSFENMTSDSLIHGIHTLITFGLSGYLKMIKNAPHVFRECLWVVLKLMMFIFSLLPQPLDLSHRKVK
ncbi:MAG: PilZ domain-containing protein [Succinivibrio sp.]